MMATGDSAQSTDGEKKAWHVSTDFLAPLVSAFAAAWAKPQCRYFDIQSVLDIDGSYSEVAAAWDRAKTWLDVRGLTAIRDSVEERIREVLREGAATQKWVRMANSQNLPHHAETQLWDFDIRVVGPFIDYLEHLSQELKDQFPPKDVPGEGLSGNGGGGQTRPKKSTFRGESKLKLVGALTKHHRYADGACLEQTPINANALARKADVAKSTANAFFNREFAKGKKGGYANYRRVCRDITALVAALKLLNGEMQPSVLLTPNPERYEKTGNEHRRHRAPGTSSRDYHK
jgi:hypothetical protein